MPPVSQPQAELPQPPLASPPNSLPRPPSKRERKSAKGYLIAGVAITSVSLGVGGLLSAHHLDSDDPLRRSAGRVGAIPFVGPIIGAGRAPDGKKTGLVMIAVYQWLGVAMLTGGAVWVDHHRRSDRKLGKEPKDEAANVVMVASGTLGALLAYGITVGIAKGTYDRSGDNRFANRLRIPAIGGALAAPYAPTNVAGYTGVASSIVQLSLLTVTAVGIARMVGKKRGRRRLSVMPVVSPRAAQLTATMRF